MSSENLSSLVSIVKPDPKIEFYKALTRAQAVIQPAVFDTKNDHFKNRFASLSSIMDACRFALADNGFSVTTEIHEGEKHWRLITIITHIHGWAINTVMPLLTPGTPTMQNLGSAISYARRYSISSMLNLVSEEDDDGENVGKPDQRAPWAGKPQVKQERAANESKTATRPTPKPSSDSHLRSDPQPKDEFPDIPAWDENEKIIDSDLDRALDSDDRHDDRMAIIESRKATAAPRGPQTAMGRYDQAGVKQETISREQAENLRETGGRMGFPVDRINLLVEKFAPLAKGRWAQLTIPEFRFILEYMKKPEPKVGE